MVDHSHKIEYVELSAIKRQNRRWRINTARQIDEARRQLERTGQVVELPLLDNENQVVCGGAIVQAARELKWSQIPVLRVANMTADELRLYAVNARALSDMGATDDVLLADGLRDLEALLRSFITTARPKHSSIQSPQSVSQTLTGNTSYFHFLRS